ncbi:MAG: glycosyltransferase family 2 protein [Hydrogenophaga sp.]|uniref:glycosyltransferase family 2 protein n=1 Tax=Hydrogenophaga sp. TaxID=1904254 RepID=UPI003D9B4347
MNRPAMPVKRVLVVIPTLDEARHIEAVLSDLTRDLPRDAAVQVAVVDGGSTDGTVDIVRRLQARMFALTLLHNPQRRQAPGINLAVRTLGAEADVLVRCDAHAVYPPGYVARLLATLDRTGADAVVVPMDSVGTTGLQRVIGWVSDTRIGSGGAAHRGGRRSGWVDHGHHAAFRLDSFRRAGGYDESFTHNEDAELDCRQRALGSRIYLDADIRLAYAPRASLDRLARQYFLYGRGRSRTVRRHPGSLRLRQLAVPLHMAACGFALLAAPWAPELLAWPGWQPG